MAFNSLFNKKLLLKLLPGALAVGIFVGVPMFKSFSSEEEAIIFIHDNDHWPKVEEELSTHASSVSMWYVKLLTALSDVDEHPRAGRYDVGQGRSILSVLRDLRNGRETPVRLTIKSVRTLDELSKLLASKLQPTTQEWRSFLSASGTATSVGKTPQTLIGLFLPNTYEVYWKITPEKLLERMAKESADFWTESRQAQAKELGLSIDEVITLASIVQQETAYNPEKKRVAGMYLNRLRMEMPLQADPTVKFALQQFGLRRILHKHLRVDSPYNTYRNKGLPPGPICIPELSSIEGVLDAEKHDYIYMCAKEDFSGQHNFATTYEEHQKNAAKYSEALDARGIQ